MSILEILLPYALVFIAAVVSFFIKGNTVNKIIALVIFAVGMFCIGAESGWWRFGFGVVVCLICSDQHRTFDNRTGGPVYIWMGILMVVLMLARWTISLFELSYWWMTVVAAIGSVVYLLNADND